MLPKSAYVRHAYTAIPGWRQNPEWVATRSDQAATIRTLYTVCSLNVCSMLYVRCTVKPSRWSRVGNMSDLGAYITTSAGRFWHLPDMAEELPCRSGQ